MLDLEKRNSSFCKEPKQEEKTKNNCDAEGEHKEMSSTFCHDTG